MPGKTSIMDKNNNETKSSSETTSTTTTSTDVSTSATTAKPPTRILTASSSTSPASAEDESTTFSSSGETTETYLPTPNIVSSDSFRRRMSQFVTPSNFILKPGEYLHDLREGSDRTLRSFANHLKAMSVYDIFLDYTRVITQDCKQPAPTFNKNEIFNRYRDIRCIEATRVKIASPSDGNDYIHANYVDGFRESKKYILTQAPFHSTLEKFWEMIWQEKSTTIVSLTALDGEKVAIYVPLKSGEAYIFGKIKVVNMGTRHIRDSYDATVLMVTKGDEPARKLFHMAYFAWPDKSTPTQPTEILHMLDDMNFNRKLLMEEAKKKGWLPNVDMPCSPIIIHCLTGVGRSGALVATEICLRKLDYSYRRASGPCVDVRDTVLRLRTQREMTVQKPEQYLFVHLVVLEYAVRRRFFDSAENVNVSNFVTSNT